MRRTCGFHAGEVSARRRRIVKKMPAQQVSWVQSKCGLCRAGVGLLVAGLEAALEAMLPSLVRLAGCRKRAHPAKYGFCRPCHIGFELRIVQEGRSRPTVVDEAVVQAATNRARIEVESMASTKRKDGCDPATKQNAVEELDAPIFDPSLERWLG